IFHDEVFVFTPKGDVIQLPQGSTVIDFAYSIHSAVGHKMIGAKINGTIVPIDRILENGEIVEVITSQSSKGPSRDWLKIVKTSDARNKIRQWYKKEKRADNIILGKSMIDNELKKIFKGFTEKQREEATWAVAARFGYNICDDFYNALGYGEILLTKMFPKIKDEFEKMFKDEFLEPPTPVTEQNIKLATPAKNLKSNSGIVVDGESGCMVKFAKCCNPLPGDKVIGFITKGYGISIHKKDCPNVTDAMSQSYDPTRWVEAHWEVGGNKESDGVYEALIQIVSYDRIGLLADVSVALADMKVSILSVNTMKRGDEQALINLKISCKNTEHYHSIVSRLKSLKDVIDVTRGYA
ncbi:MAG: bifunctional (p)ppGpp synthetase/guanosine-3',5'-bis(diphosphate) 3'-pyrophosphohydrolase, partial [Clostridia bacterium]|nr:bifunctional (p)ppGpp synthetase/guanosine-3',5'-bis(diphosphate) 3'-pyrophosphohydrolase [Clostridia bacterium]